MIKRYVYKTTNSKNLILILFWFQIININLILVLNYFLTVLNFVK